MGDLRKYIAEQKANDPEFAAIFDATKGTAMHGLTKLHVENESLLVTEGGQVVIQALGKTRNPVMAKLWAETVAEAFNTYSEDAQAEIATLKARVSALEEALRQVIEGDQGWNFAGDRSLADIARGALERK